MILATSSGSDDEASGSAGSAGEGSASQRFLCFEVMDTGVGVSRQALESLFQDYVQVRGGRGVWAVEGAKWFAGSSVLLATLLLV